MRNIATNKILFYFLITHLLIWTVVPTFSNNNLPRDTIEALAWGSNLDWGFEKHPPFSAFAVEFFYKIFGNQDWAYYFLSQIFVIIAFIGVYKFSEEFFSDKNFALLSVLLLEGIYFYNFTTPEFNVNVSQLPFWALSVYFTWRCIKYEKTTDYLFLGLCVGLGILSKYLFIYLVIAIKILFIYWIKKVKKIKLINYFIAGPITLAILLPHIIWLTENDYITITYGLHRSVDTFYSGGPTIINHFKYPLIFLLKQITILIPFFIMVSFIVKKFKIKLNIKDKKLIFIISTSILPLFLIFLTSLFFGVNIRTMWMTPFYLFFGVLILYILKNKINLKKIQNFFIIFLIFFTISPTFYFLNSIIKKDQRIDYPAKEISAEVQNNWDKNFSNEIDIVVGQAWWAGNLSYHLKSRPKYIPVHLKPIKENHNPKSGVVYIEHQDSKFTKSCPGVYFTTYSRYICMVGIK